MFLSPFLLLLSVCVRAQHHEGHYLRGSINTKGAGRAARECNAVVAAAAATVRVYVHLAGR